MGDRDMSEAEVARRLREDPDFINLAKYDYSLAKALEKYPNGLPPHLAAQAMNTTQIDIELTLRRAVTKLRARMGLLGEDGRAHPDMGLVDEEMDR